MMNINYENIIFIYFIMSGIIYLFYHEWYYLWEYYIYLF